MSDFTHGASAHGPPDARSIAATDGDSREPAESDTTEENDHEAPASPEEHTAIALGIKVALAMFLADFLARLAGFDSPTWSALSAAYLAMSPPLGSLRSALRKFGALAAGLALGALGAYAVSWLSDFPSLHFALVGLVAGALASRSADYIFAAVVGTVVTFAGADGGDLLSEVVATTACMVAIGCVVGPAVVWAVECTRRAWTGRAA